MNDERCRCCWPLTFFKRIYTVHRSWIIAQLHLCVIGYNPRPMRVAAAVLFLIAYSVLAAQAPIDPKLQGQLKQVFPEAGRFSPKAGSPPHYTAYNGEAVAGYAFW